MNEYGSDGPFFSIVTASLNKGTTIKRTLESVNRQTFKGIQHIVVDGRSSDGTLEILKSFERESRHGFTWLSEKDDGIADALNKGFRLATGRYILVLQADDELLEPDTLEKVYGCIGDERIDLWSFPIIMDHCTKGRVLPKRIQLLWWHRFRNNLPHQGIFVHHRLYERIGEFRTDFSIEFDYDFLYKSLASGCSAKFGLFPVTVMGGEGISSDPKFLSLRLREEIRVQKRNERNFLWRVAQSYFNLLYVPYKTRILSRLAR